MVIGNFVRSMKTSMNCPQLEVLMQKSATVDFNKRIGTAQEQECRVGNFGLGQRNRSGGRLVGLPSAARLFHINSFLRKKYHRRLKWESPNGTAHVESDHILVNRRWCPFNFVVVPSFSTELHLSLLRVKARLGHKMEKSPTHHLVRKLCYVLS